jgi:hypothetical protein
MATLSGLQKRVMRAVKKAIGDSPYDLDIALKAAREETAKINKQYGVDIVVSSDRGQVAWVVPLDIFDRFDA